MPNGTKSPFLFTIRTILADGIRRIDNDECSEEYASGMLSRFNAESKGFYDKHSFVNYDKAERILGIKSRQRLNELCKTNNITQKTINNQKVGFLRAEIEDLAARLRNENKKKEGR